MRCCKTSVRRPMMKFVISCRLLPGSSLTNALLSSPSLSSSEHYNILGALPLDPFGGLIVLCAFCPLPPSLLISEHFTVCCIWTSQPEAVGNLYVVFGHLSYSAGWTTANSVLGLRQSASSTLDWDNAAAPHKHGWTVAAVACVCDSWHMHLCWGQRRLRHTFPNSSRVLIV